MKDLIVANIKMNQTYSESEKYLKELEQSIETKGPKVCICLPFTSLSLANKYKDKFIFGAQNVHEEEAGQFTGEISARMLQELGVELVLIGHSERRKYYNETNDKINKKIKTALRYGFEIVLCIGETRMEKGANKTYAVLRKQIEEALNGIYENELKSIIIAYEPVWAIGTGKVAENSDITKAVETIRDIIREHYSDSAGDELKVIYGGSIMPSNAKGIYKNDSICGALVGGASLNVEEFIKLIKL